jgi:hypothetical protein
MAGHARRPVWGGMPKTAVCPSYDHPKPPGMPAVDYSAYFPAGTQHVRIAWVNCLREKNSAW